MQTVGYSLFSLQRYMWPAAALGKQLAWSIPRPLVDLAGYEKSNRSASGMGFLQKQTDETKMRMLAAACYSAAAELGLELEFHYADGER